MDEPINFHFSGSKCTGFVGEDDSRGTERFGTDEFFHEAFLPQNTRRGHGKDNRERGGKPFGNGGNGNSDRNGKDLDKRFSFKKTSDENNGRKDGDEDGN